MKKIITLLLITSFCLCGYSQDTSIRFGIRGGIGASKITGLGYVNNYGLPNANYDIVNFSSSPKLAWDMGLSFQYEKINHYFIQVNGIYDFSGENIKGVHKGNSKISSINVGGLLIESFIGKKYKLKKGTHFVSGLGPYVNIALSKGGYGGSSDVVHYGYYDDDDNYIEDSYTVGGEDPGQKELGFGANAMAGFEFGNCQVALVGNYGFTKLFKDENFNSKLRSIKLSFIYYFNHIW